MCRPHCTAARVSTGQTSEYSAVTLVKPAKANSDCHSPNSQMSIFSAMLSAFSSSTLRCRNVLCTLVWPITADLIGAHKSGCAAQEGLVDSKPYASLIRGEGHQEDRNVPCFDFIQRNFRHSLYTADCFFNILQKYALDIWGIAARSIYSMAFRALVQEYGAPSLYSVFWQMKVLCIGGAGPKGRDQEQRVLHCRTLGDRSLRSQFL